MKQALKNKLGDNKWAAIKKWGSLLVLSLALAIIIIDTTLLNVSIGTIIHDLNTTIEGVQWVITLYALVLAAFTIVGGRLGDFFGRRKMFMLGAIIFAVGSFIASISQNIGQMILGEAIIEGIGAALMLPATASLLVTQFKGKERAIAFGVWGGVAGAASAIGPILGGWLTTNYSWRWGFRINVFVAALLVAGALALIKEARDKVEKPSLDWLGILLSSSGLFLLVFGVIESSTYGWWLAKETFHIGATQITMPWGLSITPVAIFVGLYLLSMFVLYERIYEKRGKTPLVSMGIFRNWQFSSGIITVSIISLSLTGLIFALPIFYQGVQGKDAYQTGLALLPLSLSLFITSPIAVLLTKWLTPKRIVQIGLGFSVVAIYLLSKGIAVDANQTDLIWGLVLFGASAGFAQSQINNITLSAVSPQQSGEASGINGTARQLGSSFGSAIIGAVVLSVLTTSLVAGINSSTVLPTMAKPQISQAVVAQSSAIEFGTAPQLGSQVPKVVAQEIKSISNQATVDAVQRGLQIALWFALLSFLASFGLPNRKNLEVGESPTAGH
jgi:EmrB/QacA subfamily drug resistance transporter